MSVFIARSIVSAVAMGMIWFFIFDLKKREFYTVRCKLDSYEARSYASICKIRKAVSMTTISSTYPYTGILSEIISCE